MITEKTTLRVQKNLLGGGNSSDDVLRQTMREFLADVVKRQPPVSRRPILGLYELYTRDGNGSSFVIHDPWDPSHMQLTHDPHDP